MKKSVFKELELKLKDARKAKSRFEMEVQTEIAIQDFYGQNIGSINKNTLANRLNTAREYNEKFKTFLLPIAIAVLTGFMIFTTQLVLNYQKESTIDVMQQKWDDAQQKISEMSLGESYKEDIQELYNKYKNTMLLLWACYVIMFLALVLLVVVSNSPLDIWYQHHGRRAYQWECEMQYLEKAVQRMKADEIQKKRSENQGSI